MIKTIGDQIRKYSAKKGITQEELGRLVGVTTQAVSKWERGGVPDAELVPAVADALGVTMDMLFGRRRSSSPVDAILREMSLLDSEERLERRFCICAPWEPESRNLKPTASSRRI